ncbi:MAG TPA: PqqD family protein [Bacteroidia bacterium]|nr:PqqD family protein [Bacteroidia bacterium]HRS58674.1 PqqD family protein [Bacteroidia bacterium]HRU68297.1 PqqD family protein [Bacteroidia bacterium]
MVKKYTINKPHIVFDIIENEVIVINLKNGNYYNLDKLGAWFWESIEKQISPDFLTDKIASRFNIPEEEVRTDMGIFLSTLLSEKLISEVTEEQYVNSENGSMPTDFEIPGHITGYECPVLRKYSDMQNALMLDPIHEFDERGWPEMNDDLYFREHEDELAN